MVGQARGVGEQTDIGAKPAGVGGEIAAHRIDGVQHSAGVVEQALAGRRQCDAAPASRQQRDAECLFERLDPRAGRRERQMDQLRATGDAARFGDRDEQTKIDQIEPHGGSFCSVPSS